MQASPTIASDIKKSADGAGRCGWCGVLTLTGGRHSFKFAMRSATLGLAFGLLCLAFVGAADARTIHVRPGDSIQAAVDAARVGDRVVVHPGSYREEGRPCPSEPRDMCAVVISKDDISVVGRSRGGRRVVLRSRMGRGGASRSAGRGTGGA